MIPSEASPSAVASWRGGRKENSANQTPRELARQIRSDSPLAPYSRFLASSFNYLESRAPGTVVKLHTMALVHRRRFLSHISLRTLGTGGAATMPRICSARVGDVRACAPFCRIASTRDGSGNEPPGQEVGRNPGSNGCFCSASSAKLDSRLGSVCM